MKLEHLNLKPKRDKMIEEIVKDYEEQQIEYMDSIIGVLDLGKMHIDGTYPKSNFDLENILLMIELADDPKDLREKLIDFYEISLRRAITVGIPIGKVFMAKLENESRKHFDELMKLDSNLMVTYAPKIDSLKSLADSFADPKPNMTYYDLSDEEKIDTIVKSVLDSFHCIANDKEEVNKIHFEEFFKILEIDLKFAKKRCNKRIYLGPKSKLTLISRIFKDKKGKYRVTDLVKEHCEAIFEEGMRVGVRNGIKIVMDDVNSGRIKAEEFSRDDLEEMSDYFYNEIKEIIYEDVEEDDD